jgi:DinB superfamily
VTSQAETHPQPIERMRRAYGEAHRRLVARLQSVPADVAERVPPDGGWSAAQIGWHVAAVDTAFADLISGVRPSQPLPADFRERAWSALAIEIPAKLQASGRVVPPAGVRHDDVLNALAASAQKLDEALQSLTPDRASHFGVTHRAVGTITLYQVGEWATAHTIRHNAQAKRLLGR